MASSLWCPVVPFSAVLLMTCFGKAVLQTTDSESAGSTAFPSLGTDAPTVNLTEVTGFNHTDIGSLDTTSISAPETASTATSWPNSTLVVDATTDSTSLPTDATTDSTSLSNYTTTYSTLSTDATTDARLIPTDTTTNTTTGCPCDITPQFCDIGCCCDLVDCGISDLSTVFNGCAIEESYAVCIESWLMFRGNVDPALITVNESFFCVRNLEDNLTNLPTRLALSWLPKLQDFSSFAKQGVQSSNPTARGFYRVDDVILTSYNRSLLLGVFRQPSPGASSQSCVDRNPARFLRSLSLLCSRSLTEQSCLTDPRLSAHSYFSEITLLKAPVPQNVSLPGFTIPVVPLSEWPKPSIRNGSCFNVVSKVQYVLQYTSMGTVTKATVNITLTDSDVGVELLQQHDVTYQLATPTATRGPTAAVGLKPGAPVIGRFANRVQPLTIQGVSVGGDCSSSLHTRATVLFPNNHITGCVYSSFSQNCSELRSELYDILRGSSTPDLVAMNAGTEPDWTRVINQDCLSTAPEDSCESGCLIPLTLSIQLLWARRGLLSLPQSQILGAKFQFHCQRVECPPATPLAVMTEVVFSDATIYPVPPRGWPQPDWNFPFGFFSRGADEQENGPVLNGSDYTDALWVCTLWLIGFILSVVL